MREERTLLASPTQTPLATPICAQTYSNNLLAANILCFIFFKHNKPGTMGSWDAFDSYQNPLSSQFPGAPPPSHAWHTSHRDVQPRLIATTPQSGLSLDRYLQLLQLLTGGPNPATGTWVVRLLGELERAAVKLEDLKNVLAINGLVAGSKNKQDMLDKMRGIALVAPVCHIPLATTPSPPGPSLPEKNTQSGQNELLEGMRRAMEWANLSPAIKTAAANAIKQQGFYSYCPLPAIPKPARAPQNTSWEHNVDMHALVGSTPRPVPCASTTTIASRPAIHMHHVAESPTPDAIMHEAEQEEANSKHETPEWLLSSLETLMETCQGSQEIITARALIGRKARI